MTMSWMALIFSSLTVYWVISMSLPSVLTAADPVQVNVGRAKSAARNPSGKMALCIVNCAQCQDLLGAGFDHRRCSKDCLMSLGTTAIDCTNPASVRKYIAVKRSSAGAAGQRLDLPHPHNRMRM
ncbi:hypothetical protein BV898_14820 [Hypsibius exemplaris]|uniref:Eclosion hormone n=1 Tax=Hypsibius exemplaris TaxID=2072580 RepID=A0A9X6RJN3_HYPEX|nr:hypothetical protein BV898_14820 [Hypsibius exemplaris]